MANPHFCWSKSILKAMANWSFGLRRFPAVFSIYKCVWKSASSNPYTGILKLYIRSLMIITGWWFGTCFIFPYIGHNHPNWLHVFFLRGVETTDQIMNPHLYIHIHIYIYIYTYISIYIHIYIYTYTERSTSSSSWNLSPMNLISRQTSPRHKQRPRGAVSGGVKSRDTGEPRKSWD